MSINKILNFCPFNLNGFYVDVGPRVRMGTDKLAVSDTIVVEVLDPDGDTVDAWLVEAENWNEEEATRIYRLVLDVTDEETDEVDEEYEYNRRMVRELSCCPDGLTSSEAHDILYDY